MAAKTLKAIDPQAAEPSKPKVLIYGKPGVGKTWASLDFPSVYYVDTEGGADLKHYTDKLTASGGAYFGIDQGSLDFGSIIDEIQILATQQHRFKTLVVDSISKIYNLAIANEAERLGDRDAFGASKKPALAHMRRLISWLTRLDMNVILIAHEKEEWGVDAKGNRAQVGSTFDCYDKLEYELHLCLNIYKNGADHMARVRKSRLTGFPTASVMPWAYSEFATRYGKDVIEKQGQLIQLATDEQLIEVKRLIENVKLPDGQVGKWFTTAAVDSWEEMGADTIAKIIGNIKKSFNV